MNIKLGPPKVMELKPRITVIGVGGAGCNAINNMIATELDGVEFIVANTDAQSLSMSNAERRIQLGTNLTEGLGAGARPEVGEAAAREAEDDIRAEIAGSHMVFIAAGMGGGTGTGAAAIIAGIARDLGILTVGIVSKPFQFEGARRMRTADSGIAALEKVVDTLIVIPNQNLFRIANERTTFAEAFRLADQVLYSGIACIVDLIIKEGLINLDFADVQAVMKGMGAAMMGTGEATGEDRALQAANEAIANPLLDNVTLAGAQGLLISIVGGSDLTLYEVDTAASHIRKEVAPDANIIVGATMEPGMDDRIRVSIVASGMSQTGSTARNLLDQASLSQPASPTPGFAAARASPTAAPGGLQSAVKPSPAVRPPGAAAPGALTSTVRQADTQPATAPYTSPAAPDRVPPSAPTQNNTPPRQRDDAPAQNRSKERQQLEPADMDVSEADAFARALSEAMAAADTSDDGRDRTHQVAGKGNAPAKTATERAGAAETWQSSDGVLVEEGLAGRRAVHHPPPLPRRDAGDDESPGAAEFEPVPPVQTRRSIPRIPKLSDFPEVAQREYFAKMEETRRISDAAGANRSAPDPARAGRHEAARPDRELQTYADQHPGQNHDRQPSRPQAAAEHRHDEPPRPSILQRLTGGLRK